MPKTDPTTELADVIRSETTSIARQLDKLLDRLGDAEFIDQAQALVELRKMAKRLGKLCPAAE